MSDLVKELFEAADILYSIDKTYSREDPINHFLVMEHIENAIDSLNEAVRVIEFEGLKGEQ